MGDYGLQSTHATRTITGTSIRIDKNFPGEDSCAPSTFVVVTRAIPRVLRTSFGKRKRLNSLAHIRRKEVAITQSLETVGGLETSNDS